MKSLGFKGIAFLASRFFLLIAVTFGMSSIFPASAFYVKDGRKFEDIDIMSVSDAECVLYRRGKFLQRAVVPHDASRKYRIAVAHVDITDSRDDITIVCSRERFRQQSKIISFKPIDWEYINPPCASPDDVTISAKQSCETRNVIVEYPEAVRLLLQPLD